MQNTINEQDFIEYLKTRGELWTNSEGVISYSEYFDYRDQLSPETMAEILENKEPDISINAAVHWYLEEKDWLSYNYAFHKIGKEYAESRKLDFDEVEDELDELIMKHVDYDPNIDTLLGNSSPDDLHIIFGENWDDTYIEMEKWNEYKSYLEDDETTIDELNEALSETELGWLLETQGYTPYDVFENHKKPLGNKFLNQVYSELFEYVTSLEGMQLTTSLESSDWDTIVAIHENKPFIIKAGSAFGLFNSVHGSGCGFEIQLEKDIVVQNKDYEYGLSESHAPYSYSPSYVYGGSMANGHNNISLA